MRAHATDVLVRAKAHRQSAAGADLPSALALHRQRVGESAADDDAVAVNVVVTLQSKRATAVPSLRVAKRDATAERAGVIAYRQGARDVRPAVAEGKITLTNLCSRRARAEHETSNRSNKMSELHLASRPLVSRLRGRLPFGLARLACHFDDI